MSFSPFLKKHCVKYGNKSKFKKSQTSNREISSSAIYLVIVESPSKCEKIESFLGPKYHCIASKGHIRNIDGLKSIDVKNNFRTEFNIIEDKKDHVECMKKVISQFQKQNIILATDDDREGEAIAWHICQVFELEVMTTKRIVFREITKSALLSAIEKPIHINMKLVYAQHARQVLDMIVGYKISPILWKFLYRDKENTLSAGRCQTPALRLVYDKEKEESKKEITQVYKTFASFFQTNLMFELSRELKCEREIEQFLEKSKEFQHILSIFPIVKRETSPPTPFNTSNLLQTVSNILHISPKETMSLCQQLYQEGYITYMRTDSVKYSATFISEIREFIDEKYCSDAVKKNFVGNLSDIENKDETNPHEAIRVTHLEYNTISSENPKLSSLYKVIWKNTVESCMSNYEYNVKRVSITAPDNSEYITNIEIPTFLGWKKVANSVKTEEQNSLSGLLLFLESIQQRGNPIKPNYVKTGVSIHNVGNHYTEASLIKQLENIGIGRPSTFASIIETIQERGYVKKMDIEGKKKSVREFELRDGEIMVHKIEKVFGNEKNKLVIQSVGVLTCEFLVSHFENIFSYDYTKRLEYELDEVASGKKEKWYEICNECLGTIKYFMKNIDIKKPEFNIDDHHTLVYEKYGPVIRVKNGTNEKAEYKSVKKDMMINLEMVKRGEYSLEDLLEIENRSLGEYQGNELFVKNGKYGWYVEWGAKTQSIKDIDGPIDKISIEDVVRFLERDRDVMNEKQNGVNRVILRVLNENLSIRKGKYGNYIFYQKDGMKKPEFLNLKKFKNSVMTCSKQSLIEWINEYYKLNEKIEE
jgi:DNA topoisomerase-1